MYSAAVWLQHVREELGDTLDINWRYFPLDQVNSAEGPEWKLWEQPDSHRSRGRVAFQAASAARLQGDEAFERFHNELLRLKHADGKDHGRPLTLKSAAETAGLDLERFEADRVDRQHLAQIGEDYEEATSKYGVFGTPTFVFPDGASAYLRMLPAAPPEDAVSTFESFVHMVRAQPFIHEIKRPTPPKPAG